MTVKKESEPVQNNTRGLIAVLIGLGGLCWILWQAQANSTETLERLTNQRLDLMEARVTEAIAHMRQDSHPVSKEWHKNLQGQITDNRSAAEDDNKRELEDAGKDEQMTEKLREIETQFRHMDRFIQLLWQRVYSEPLPNPPPRSD